jgi:hypothetical protein
MRVRGTGYEGTGYGVRDTTRWNASSAGYSLFPVPYSLQLETAR